MLLFDALGNPIPGHDSPPSTSDDKAKDTKKPKVPVRPQKKEVTGDAPTNSTLSSSGNIGPGSGKAKQLIGSSIFSTTQDEAINIRRYNPLSKLSSYTYNLTLYMVGKDAVNRFYDELDVGNIPNPHTLPGVYIVAKSGGINNNSERRALTVNGDIKLEPPSSPGFNFFIDNLSFETITPGNADLATPTAQTTFNFKITEPNSYSFIPALKHAATQIMQIDVEQKRIKSEDVNPLKMAFMIGIKFYGYDVDGNMIGAGDVPPDSSNGKTGDKYALYERFYPIYITDLTYKLSGDATTVYDVSAISFPLQAYTENFNVIPNKLSVKGSTVREVLGHIESALNKIQQDQVKDNKRSIANQYKIVFADNATDIGDARFNVEPSQSYSTNPKGGNKKPTPADGARAQTYDTGTRAFNFEPTPTTKMIESVVTASTYLADSVSLINDSKLQTIARKKAAANEFTWYTIVPKVKILKMDDKTQQNAYEITYVINKQQVPMVRSNYVAKTTKFYGPSKIYDYYYTGKNTEVRSLEFDFKTSFFAATPVQSGKEAKDNPKKIPANTTGAFPADATHFQNNDFAYQRAVISSLYNIVDNASLNMTIMGDPDFIMTQLEAPTKATQHYGMYNPINRQIFIEVRLKGAIDYSRNPENGLMVLGPMASMYKDERLRAELTNFHEKNNDDRRSDREPGLIYRSVRITSNFSNGLFTQDIQDAILFPEELLKNNLGIMDEAQRGDEKEKTDSASSSSTSTRTGTSGTKTAAAKPPAKPDPAKNGYDPTKFQDDASLPVNERLSRFGSRIQKKWSDWTDWRRSKEGLQDNGNFPARDNFDKTRSGPL
jgi:hypothetical protein